MFNVTKKILVAFIIAASVGSTAYANVNDLASEALSVYNRLHKLETQKKEATGQQKKRLRDIESQIKKLCPETIVSYNRKIQQNYERIEQYKITIAELQSKIAEYEKENPNPNKLKVDKLNTEFCKLSDEHRKIVKPFNEQISKAKQVPNKMNDAYEEAMSKYCLKPGNDFAEVAKTKVTSKMERDMISYYWEDAKGKKVAWAHVRLRDKPKIPAKAKMLDNTYYMTGHSNGSIWVWAGHFQVAFIMTKPEWKEKENMPKAIKSFVDLKGLAKINPTSKTRTTR